MVGLTEARPMVGRTVLFTRFDDERDEKVAESVAGELKSAEKIGAVLYLMIGSELIAARWNDSLEVIDGSA